MAETVASILKNKGTVVWSIGPEATVYDAIDLMAQKSIGALPVVLEGRVVGILSERDYARKVILQGRSSKDTRVREIMTASVITATRDDTIDQCMRVMTNRRIRHLPVLDGGRLAGIVSMGDLVKAIVVEQAETIEHLHSYITGGR